MQQIYFAKSSQRIQLGIQFQHILLKKFFNVKICWTLCYEP